MTTGHPDTSTAIELLKSGATISEILDRTQMSPGEVAALAETTGLAPEHNQQALEHLLKALIWGETNATSKRARNLAARARTALAELTQMHEHAAKVRRAEAEVEALKKKLTVAQARLKDAMNDTATPAATTGPSSKAERLKIRDWARRNGHQVPDRGVIPQRIVDAYNNRQPKPGGTQ